MSLYPLKFHPIYVEKIWGGSSLATLLQRDMPSAAVGESWELSGVAERQSVVCNGALAGQGLQQVVVAYREQLVGRGTWEKFGSKFPLLIKLIDACDDLSIQVHPGDALAQERHQSLGKTEMWYVLHAEPGATLIVGFTEALTPARYRQLVEQGRLPDVLKRHEVKAGDAFFIPAGLVHAVGRGVVLAEVQQASDITYRIYDYDRKDSSGRPRELHVEQALAAIDFAASGGKVAYREKLNEPIPLASCPYFTANLLKLTGCVRRSYRSLDSFVIYLCTKGAGHVVHSDGEKASLRCGETLLIPASLTGISLVPDGGMELLEVRA